MSEKNRVRLILFVISLVSFYAGYLFGVFL